MSSSKEYLELVLSNLVNDVTYKKMMGEYILYKNNVIFGGIYDDRFLIKKNYLFNDLNLKEEIPYPNAKPMFLVDVDDRELLSKINNLLNNI